ncbi:MAG: DUF1648 domain-containing protein [Calditrichaeota bacterium]|nr:DUF1648 domain-containing protein [Calditrichota bacterium]
MNAFSDRMWLSLERTARYVFWAIVLLLLWQILSAYSHLPDKVVSHFDITGKPNGWMSKQAFLRLDVFLVGFLALLFYFSGFIMNKIPNTFINLPNKAYWLAPERRDKSLRVINSFLLWFGNATLIFIFVLLQDVIDYNLNPQNYSAGMNAWTPALLYLLFIFLWTAGLFLRFRRPQNKKGL